jgi:hypothetical protein
VYVCVYAVGIRKKLIHPRFQGLGKQERKTRWYSATEGRCVRFCGNWGKKECQTTAVEKLWGKKVFGGERESDVPTLESRNRETNAGINARYLCVVVASQESRYTGLVLKDSLFSFSFFPVRGNGEVALQLGSCLNGSHRGGHEGLVRLCPFPCYPTGLVNHQTTMKSRLR